MATSRSKARRRRTFLKQIPAAIAAGLAAPAVLAADAAQTPPTPQTNGGLTADTLAAAQQVAAVSLPATELESARSLVNNNLRNIALVRDVALTPDVEPAFSYRPPRPKAATRVARAARTLPVPGPRPANLEDLAF